MVKSYNLYSKNITEDTPIIFLDIDGVISSNFDPSNPIGNIIVNAVKEFNIFINTTNAKVILSSFRTYFQGFQKVEIDLLKMGVKCDVVDYVQYLDSSNIVEEKNKRITNYVIENNLRNFIILDDYDLFKNGNIVMLSHFIRVLDTEKGFDKNIANKAFKLIKIKN